MKRLLPQLCGPDDCTKGTASTTAIVPGTTSKSTTVHKVAVPKLGGLNACVIELGKLGQAVEPHHNAPVTCGCGAVLVAPILLPAIASNKLNKNEIPEFVCGFCRAYVVGPKVEHPQAHSPSLFPQPGGQRAGAAQHGHC